MSVKVMPPVTPYVCSEVSFTPVQFDYWLGYKCASGGKLMDTPLGACTSCDGGFLSKGAKRTDMSMFHAPLGVFNERCCGGQHGIVQEDAAAILGHHLPAI